jgi:hypothetical protein
MPQCNYTAIAIQLLSTINYPVTMSDDTYRTMFSTLYQMTTHDNTEQLDQYDSLSIEHLHSIYIIIYFPVCVITTVTGNTQEQNRLAYKDKNNIISHHVISCRIMSYQSFPFPSLTPCLLFLLFSSLPIFIVLANTCALSDNNF